MKYLKNSNSIYKTSQSTSDILEVKIKLYNKKRSWQLFVAELMLTVVGVYVLVGMIFGISIIKGDSMEPNLKTGDIAVFFRLTSDYAKGDIVILHNSTTEDYIKRIVAVGGDTVSIDNKEGRLLISGEEEKQKNIYAKTYKYWDSIEYPLEVGEESFFLLGDNREISKDSRRFGMVNKEQIAGKVLFVLRGESRL